MYNLQTLTEWYASQSLIVHNCRCTAEPDLESIFESWNGPSPDAPEAPPQQVTAWVNTASLKDVKATPRDPGRTASIEKAHQEGKELPPIRVGILPDGTRNLIDGNHRLARARKKRQKQIKVTFEL